MKVTPQLDLRARDEDFINLNPLQTGGRTYPETRKAVSSYVDGYSVCDWCAGDLCSITKPGVQGMLGEISEFLGMEESILTNGCREAKYIVMHTMCRPGDTIVVDGNAHYSTLVAAERAGLNVVKTGGNTKPEYKVTPQSYREAIEKAKKEAGKPPKLTVLTHVDGSYGNLADAKAVADISREYGMPLLLNTAYSSGRMPVDGKKLGADFIACSGHKSWAAGGGNIGMLSSTGEYSEKIFRKSAGFKIKPLEILGCSTRGAQTLALMASLPHVKERVKKWGEEVEKARKVAKEFGKIGIDAYGETPRNHDIIFCHSEKLYEISQTHKKKNYFLYRELKERGIMGIKAGLTKQFKISTYRLNDLQIRHVIDSFKDIMETLG